jgi:hypothetical protein
MELLVLIGFALLVSGGFLGLDFVKLTGHALDAKFGWNLGIGSSNFQRSTPQWHPRSRKARDLGHPAGQLVQWRFFANYEDGVGLPLRLFA